MARTSRRTAPKRRSARRVTKARNVRLTPRPKTRATERKPFVGRPSSPVLDHYPSRSGEAPATAPPPAAPPAPLERPLPIASTPAPSAPAPATSPPPAAASLISLDRPFDVDEFSQSLGETSVRVVVPREDLAEVLRRVMDFMGFGIYVYAIHVAPEEAETLKRFVVDLQRVDYSAARRRWVPFEEKGRADSPFGPGAGSGPA
jgi:hypothetical protein